MSLDTVGTAFAADPILPFKDLLDITEEAFVKAGNGLVDSVGDIQSLRSAFAALETVLGPEADAALKAQVIDVTARSEVLRHDFDDVSAATRGLRDIMMGIRSEVRALNTVVSLFANISINARIQGNSLGRPRPQINSFIERLGNLSSEADDILREVNDAMATALDALTEIEAAQSALADELRQRTLPSIETFTGVARGISSEQASLRMASFAIAENLQAVSSDVSRLVTSLQIGDTLRQRLEQVHAAIALAGPMRSDQTLSLLMASTLADGALAEAAPCLDEALTALSDVAARGEDIARTATSSAFGSGAGRQAREGGTSVAAFESSLAATRHHFASMQTSAQKARDQIEIILSHDPALQGIAQNLRLAGINAVIACARLGEEGRALRELAQWLRANTDESDSTMQRLQAALGRSHQAVTTISRDLIAKSENDLASFLAAASDLGGAIDNINDCLGSAYSRFDGVSRSLGERLASAMAALRMVQGRVHASGPTVQTLRFLTGFLPPADVGTETAQEYLVAIRKKYTMASERHLHDSLVASLSGQEAPVMPEIVPAKAPAAAAAEDDLDDILF